MTTHIPEDLISALIRLGFSQYEAQAYCALLQRSPMNGHEVGKLSQVPPSKIYETLQRLEAKGAVLSHRSEPIRYAAVPYSEVLARIRERFEGDLAVIDRGLASLPAAREPGLVWSLRDRIAIVTAFKAAIDGARQSLFAAIWDEEMPLLRASLEAAAGRGVEGSAYGHGQQRFVLAATGVARVVHGDPLVVLVLGRCSGPGPRRWA